MLKYQSDWGGEYDIGFSVSSYRNNSNTYVGMICDEGPFADLTVNIRDLPEGFACLDTNNIPNAEAFVKENNLGTPTGTYAQSGFCTYPIYKLNIDEINKHLGLSPTNEIGETGHGL